MLIMRRSSLAAVLQKGILSTSDSFTAGPHHAITVSAPRAALLWQAILVPAGTSDYPGGCSEKKAALRFILAHNLWLISRENN
jgi:hypothetical protein